MAAESGRGAVAEEEFSERELEVAAILADLPSIVRAERRRHRRLEKQQRPEIPTWGRRRPRKAPAAVAAAAEKQPAAAVVAAEDDHHRRDGAASPDTPLAFPVDDHEADDDEDRKKAAAQDEWAQQQRGAVASLSHENAHLLKIEEFRARLETSRSTHDSLSQMQQSKHKKRNRPEEEEEEARRWKQQACPAADRPALDLNEPAEADGEDARPQIVAAQWCHRGHQLQQLMQQKAAQTAAARRRRREIRRAKASVGSSGRTRRLG
ncbi:unnamed protein product [Alopecurus aequalis]